VRDENGKDQNKSDLVFSRAVIVVVFTRFLLVYIPCASRPEDIIFEIKGGKFYSAFNVGMRGAFIWVFTYVFAYSNVSENLRLYSIFLLFIPS
jgi:hypothetical protein